MIKKLIKKLQNEYFIRQSRKITAHTKELTDAELVQLNNNIADDIEMANNLGDKVPKLVKIMNDAVEFEMQQRGLRTRSDEDYDIWWATH